MKQETKSWLLLFSLALIWGASFILMKRGMETTTGQAIFSDEQVASIRMTIASVALLPFALKNLKKVKSFRVWLFLLISGLTGNFFPAFLFTYAETGLGSGYTGMLNSFTPIFTIILGFIFFKNRITPLQIIGIIIATIGITLLSSSGDLTTHGNPLIFIGAVILATFCYAISLNVIKFELQSLKAIEITSLAFFTILLPSSILTITTGSLQTIQSNPLAGEGLIYIFILSIIGTAFAVALFSQLISISTTIFSSSVTYLIPIVALCFGLLDGETISITQISSMLIVLAGIFLANFIPQLLNRRKFENKTTESLQS